MVVRKARRVDMECVVRAYLAGSAWSEYKSHGTVNGAALPAGLREAERLPDLLFTPSTKEASGHDRPLTRAQGESLVGRDLYSRLEALSKAVFRAADDHASKRGMLIADTKMEFGYTGNELILIDELLTPDSSRFWDAAEWRPGSSPPAFDKQYVRDWLTASGWNKEPPGPALPPDVIERTRERYVSAFTRLTGRQLVS
jgi:phosphoribosylaminoimidazole-succinocarboxamide synthase